MFPCLFARSGRQEGIKQHQHTPYHQTIKNAASKRVLYTQNADVSTIHQAFKTHRARTGLQNTGLKGEEGRARVSMALKIKNSLEFNQEVMG